MISCRSMCQFTIKRLYKIDILSFFIVGYTTRYHLLQPFLIIEKVTLFPMTSSLDQPFFFNPNLLKPQLSKLLIYLMLLKCISSHMHTCKRYVHLTRVSNNSPQSTIAASTWNIKTSIVQTFYVPTSCHQNA